jgi:hypothetical protein
MDKDFQQIIHRWQMSIGKDDQHCTPLPNYKLKEGATTTAAKITPKAGKDLHPHKLIHCWWKIV